MFTAADGTAAELKRGGLVADEKRNRCRPAEVDGAGLAGSVWATDAPTASRPVAVRAGAPI
jgi:hypothetical protein